MPRSALFHATLKHLRDLMDGAPVTPPDVQTMRQLLDEDGVASDLVGLILSAKEGKAMKATKAEGVLLDRLLDEARMDSENGGGRGSVFLKAVDAAIHDALDRGAVTFLGVTILGGGFARAGLPAPDVLADWVMNQDTPETRASTETTSKAFIDKLIRDARKDAYALHAFLAESMSVTPSEVKAEMVRQIGQRSDPIARKMLLYWLMDRDLEVRLSAAIVLEERMKQRTLDRDTAVLLVGLRPWMVPDLSREIIDRAIRLAQRTMMADTEALRSTSKSKVTVERVIVTVPDGTGSQQVMILLHSGKKRRLAVALTKTGHGVKDAFVIDGSRHELDAVLVQDGQVASVDVELGVALDILAAALGEGLDLSLTAPPGMVDILEALRIEALLPTAATLDAWHERADPGGEVAAMTVQKRGRLIGESRDWAGDLPMFESWFEDTASLAEALADCRTERAAQQVAWQSFEDRRPFWTRQIFRAAHVMRATGRERLAQSLAATGAAILDGRPLRKVPAFEDMVMTTLDAFIGNHASAVLGAPDPGAPDFPQAMVPKQVIKEDLEDLAAFLDADEARMSLSELDGFMTAYIICPKFVSPATWIGAIWGNEEPEFNDINQLNRLLQIAMSRYNQIIGDFQAGRAAPIMFLDEDGGPDVSEWADGFLLGMARMEPEAWDILDRSALASKVLSGLLAASSSPAGSTVDEKERSKLRQILKKEMPAMLLSLYHEAEKFREPFAMDTGAGSAPRRAPKAGRNDPCPCGSGKKYKKCCGG